jgi:hypothetical protein
MARSRILAAGMFAAVLVALVALPGAGPAAAAAPVDNCLECHSGQGTPAAKAFRSDVHFKAGLTCADCHGGDASKDDQDQAMSRAAGFMGRPKPGAIPAMCGKCHGPGQNRFKAGRHLDDVAGAFGGSAHGAALKASPDGPQCVSCHGVHNIAAVKDPRSPVYPNNVPRTCARCHGTPGYMKAFTPSLPVDQYEKYLTSVHGRRNLSGDPRPATCVSCHSNHAVMKVKDPRSPVYPMRVPETCGRCHSDAKYMAGYGIPTDQLEGYRQSVHGVALLKNSDLNAPACNSCHGNHGAAPPGVASVENVCGMCHQANAELYDKSPHKKAFVDGKLPGCVVCHGNHKVAHTSDAMLGFGHGSACASCHHDTPADKAAAGIRRSRAALDSLTVGRAEAESTLTRAEQLGMDVEEARYSLKSVNQSLVESRVQVHAFEAAPLVASAAPGIKAISKARLAGLAAVKEYHFRRQGLAVSTLIITALAILLYLKIRQIERRQKDEKR